MEPETTEILNGVGHKNPTIHVLDSLMGMGKSTALINMIKARVHRLHYRHRGRGPDP